jgi:hypothetical protein
LTAIKRDDGSVGKRRIAIEPRGAEIVTRHDWIPFPRRILAFAARVALSA